VSTNKSRDSKLNNNQGKIVEKQQILFVGPLPPPFAGPEIAMVTLLESPLNDQFKIDILKTNVRQSNKDKGRLDVHMIWAFFSFIFRLSRALFFQKPKLVYYFVTATQMGWMGRDIWCIFLTKLFGSKIVIHMRAGHFMSNYRQMPSFSQTIIKLACGKVSKAFVQGESLKNQFTGLIAPECYQC